MNVRFLLCVDWRSGADWRLGSVRDPRRKRAGETSAEKLPTSCYPRMWPDIRQVATSTNCPYIPKSEPLQCGAMQFHWLLINYTWKARFLEPHRWHAQTFIIKRAGAVQREQTAAFWADSPKECRSATSKSILKPTIIKLPSSSADGDFWEINDTTAKIERVVTTCRREITQTGRRLAKTRLVCVTVSVFLWGCVCVYRKTQQCNQNMLYVVKKKKKIMYVHPTVVVHTLFWPPTDTSCLISRAESAWPTRSVLDQTHWADNVSVRSL